MNLFSRFLQVRDSTLPTTSKLNFQQTALLSLPKRYIRLLLLILAVGVLFTFFSNPYQDLHDNSSASIRYSDIPYPKVQLTPPDKSSDLPPLYEEYRDYEDRVSNWNLKTNGKASDGYIYVSHHASGAGWGNIMQELVFSTLLASGSGRGFVWDEYIWNNDSSKYSQFNGKFIPSRIPFSTMIAGHILGLPKSPGLPPSISKRVYDRICPHSEQLYVDEPMVKEHIGLPKDSDQLGWHMPGQQVLDAWLSFLDTPAVRDKKCILISGPQIFNIWLLHNSRLHSLMKTLLSSPVLNNWGWSELVLGVFRKNSQLFVSTVRSISLRFSSLATRWPPRNKDAFVPSSSDELVFQDDTSLPLLALHLRRGDYEGHCQSFAREHSTYVGMDTLPEFEERDAFVPPNITYDRESVPEEVSAYFTKHCFPSATQVSQRVREVLHDYEKVLDAEDRKLPGRGSRWFWRLRWYGRTPLVREKVKKVYIMSNGNAGWLYEVKKVLMKDANRSAYSREWEFVWSWEDIGNSRDLKAGWEEKRVLQLVDMYVGRRAELFVGNGFSTLTSNIVMLRKHRGLHPVQTRFW